MRPFILPGFALVLAAICGYVAISLAVVDHDDGIPTAAIVCGVAALLLVGYAALLWFGREWRIFAFVERDPIGAVRRIVTVGLVPVAVTAWASIQGIDDELGHSLDRIVANAPKPVDPKSAEISRTRIDTSLGEATLKQVMPTIAKTVDSYAVQGRLPATKRLEAEIGLPRRYRIEQVRNGPGSAYSFCFVDQTMKVWARWSSQTHRLTATGSGVVCGRHELR